MGFAVFFDFGGDDMDTGVVIAGMAMQTLGIALSPMPLRNDRFMKLKVAKKVPAARLWRETKEGLFFRRPPAAAQGAFIPRL